MAGVWLVGSLIGGIVLGMLVSADPKITNDDLVRYHDDAAKVTCFRVKYKDSIQCFPDAQISHREERP